MSATPEQEIKRLRAELDAWENLESRLCPEDVGFEEMLTALRSQLAEAQRDTERLDWLNGRLNWFTTQGPGHDPKYADIRERIDAARSTPERGDPEGTT